MRLLLRHSKNIDIPNNSQVIAYLITKVQPPFLYHAPSEKSEVNKVNNDSVLATTIGVPELTGDPFQSHEDIMLSKSERTRNTKAYFIRYNEVSSAHMRARSQAWGDTPDRQSR